MICPKNCAYCGEPLKYSGRVAIQGKLPGKPVVGWHAAVSKGAKDQKECRTLDPLANAIFRGEFDGTGLADSLAAYRAIEARGPGRLHAGKHWDSKASHVRHTLLLKPSVEFFRHTLADPHHGGA